MKIGINSGAVSGPETTLDGLISRAQDMEKLGFDCFWMAHMFGLDAMTALAQVAQQTKTIKLGTAVVPSYPRHPLMMAQQAATTNAAQKDALLWASACPTSPSSKACLAWITASPPGT